MIDNHRKNLSTVGCATVVGFVCFILVMILRN